MRLNIILSTLVALCAPAALGLPTSEAIEASEFISIAEGGASLFKRGYSACSHGVAVNCGSASTSCSNRNCKVCCGNCCKQVTGMFRS